MIIEDGYFRGAKCQIFLMQETGIICVSVDYSNVKEMAKQFADYISQNFIRKALLIPDDADSNAVRVNVYVDSEMTGFQWSFNESVLGKGSTKWGLVHFICNALDKITDEMKSHEKNPSGKILFRKGSLISFKFEGDDIIIKHRDPEDYNWHHPDHTFKGAAKLFQKHEEELKGTIFMLNDDIFDTTLTSDEFDDVVVDKIMGMINKK